MRRPAVRQASGGFDFLDFGCCECEGRGRRTGLATIERQALEKTLNLQAVLLALEHQPKSGTARTGPGALPSAGETSRAGTGTGPRWSRLRRGRRCAERNDPRPWPPTVGWPPGATRSTVGAAWSEP